jgi:methylmalonyl-CoA/ethylmalonyl-CoA epimerase
MPINLNRIGQIAIGVRDVDVSESFYRDKLGLRHLYRFGDLTFFDCCGVRLMIERANEASDIGHASPVYFACADIVLAVHELRKRNIALTIEPHLIAKMEDHDLWMAFFEDPDGNAAMSREYGGSGPRPVGPSLSPVVHSRVYNGRRGVPVP